MTAVCCRLMRARKDVKSRVRPAILQFDKYDAMGRLLYEKIPEQTATINEGTGTMWTSARAYTEYGALKKKTDARGVESHYAYDALHNVIQVWFTGVGGDDSGSVRPGLPSGVAATEDRFFEYTSWGALSSVTIPNKYTERYAFDSFFRVSSVTRWILGQTSDTRKTYTTTYAYNLGSQLSKMIYPSGQHVSVNHDDKGRMQSLTNEPGDTIGYLTGMSYNIAGQVTGLTLANGVVESYGYDANRLQMTTQTATKGATSLMNLTYNYQASAGQMGTGSTAGNAGQLMSISGTVNGTTESAVYTYDLLGRLGTSNQTSNGTSAQRRFAYDRWGNPTGVWDAVSGGAQIQSITYPSTFQQGGSAPTNRIGTVTNNGSTVNYSYDAAGNVTNDGLHTYAYDAENRVVNVDAGATAQYQYDHQNRRVTKVVGSSWTHYVWRGSQVIGEHDATTAYSTNPTYQVKSARLDYIYAGGRMIRSRQRTSSTGTWTSRYFLSDRLSVRMTLDTSGNVMGRMAHFPFGEGFAESGTQEKHHFTSYERDAESGLDYALNRQYSQSVGRFNRVDPLVSSARIGAPQSWNRYSYTRNEPINSIDPLGLDPSGMAGLGAFWIWYTLFGDTIKISTTEYLTGGSISSGEMYRVEDVIVFQGFGTFDPFVVEDPQSNVNDIVWYARTLLEAKDACLQLLGSGFADPETLIRYFARLSNRGRIHPGTPQRVTTIAETRFFEGELPEIVLGPLFFEGTSKIGEGETFPDDLSFKDWQTMTMLHELGHAAHASAANHADSDTEEGRRQAAEYNGKIFEACIK